MGRPKKDQVRMVVYVPREIWLDVAISLVPKGEQEIPFGAWSALTTKLFDKHRKTLRRKEHGIQP